MRAVTSARGYPGLKPAIAPVGCLVGMILTARPSCFEGDSMYYDIDKTCSYNALINIVIGGRGIGKTYGWKKKAIRDFVRKGKQFGYIRRYESELKEVKDTLFNDIIFNNEFPELDIQIKGNEYYINDELAGYAFSLTKAKDYKSASFPMVQNLLFDEFIIEGGRTGAGGYLSREPDKLLDLYETIARMRDVTLFMFANAITLANPYFLQWEITFPKGKNTYLKNDILAQVLEADSDFVSKKNSTRFGKIARELGYANYSIDNKFYLDEEALIIKKGKNTRFYFTLVWHGKKYGFWRDFDEQISILSYDYDPCCTLVFTLDKRDINASTLYMKSSLKHPYFRKLKEALETGTLAYESDKIKHELKSMLVLIF